MNKDYKARSNKRRSKDSVVFEQNLERNLYGLWKSINEKALSKFKNVLYWNSEKNSFSTKELKHS